MTQEYLNQEYVVLVDHNNQPIGVEEKLKAHREGLLHRAFSVFAYRYKERELQFLLQQREANKYHCGDLWTNTCCSHPRVNEDIVDAGERRLKEELNLELSLQEVGSFYYKAVFDNGLTEHEWDHVLIGEVKFDPLVLFNPTEVQAIEWVGLADILSRWARAPDRYTPWFKQALDIAVQSITLDNNHTSQGKI